ncbi:hypothetical protein LOTGIDRAFT_235513 [Lottia gigantea]|uniref:Tetraspanin n=1 Tax=Lottia gigantea TaxID=225164 RepID=V3ZU77_LOTGI|nr:hypothetical protein LOTGIDRAFT_235513 [Lottia gigantea]ESO86140.1 hypothetical protein LOTGIDRAFT_235513 [Lottia gigantea]
MEISELTRNCLGVLIAILCVVMTAFGFCVICGAVFLKLHMDNWTVLFHEYDPKILFISLLTVGCVIFLLHIYGTKLGYATGFVETREAYQIGFMPLMVFMVLLIVGMVVTGALCLVHRDWLAEGFRNGMLSRIKMYRDDMHVKSVIDELQMRYKCCGSLSYKDWFDVSWIGKGFVDIENPDVKKRMEKGQYITDDAPFSCCQMESMRPCIFHKVTQYELHQKYDEITLYKAGCSANLSSFYDKFILYPALCGLFGASGVEFFIIICLRHLQTSINAADNSGYPSGYGDSKCCAPEPAYNPHSYRMRERQGYTRGRTSDGWDRNYSNIGNSISYNEDLELKIPKEEESDKVVLSAEKTASDGNKTTNNRKKKWLGQQKGSQNDKTKQDRITTTIKNDGIRNSNTPKGSNVGNFSEEKANDQSKTSNIQRKKWLGQRKKDSGTSQNTKFSTVSENEEFGNPKPSKSVRFADEEAIDQNKSTTKHRKSWLGKQNRKQCV